MFGSLASFGGLGYAATGAENAATAVRKAVTPSTKQRQRVVSESAAQKQYPTEKVLRRAAGAGRR